MIKTIFTPDTIKKATSKVALAKTVKLIGKKMPLFHNSLESICSFYLNLEYAFKPEDKAPLLLVGKMGKWKNVAKTDTAKPETAKTTLRGAAFLRMAEDGVTPEALVLMPVKGKAKEMPVIKALKPLTKKLGIQLIIEQGMSEEQLNELEVKEDQAPDMPDDEMDEEVSETEVEAATADTAEPAFDAAALMNAYKVLNETLKTALPSLKATSITKEVILAARQVVGDVQNFKNLLADAPEAEAAKFETFLTKIDPLANRANQIVSAVSKAVAKPKAEATEDMEAIKKAKDRNLAILKELSDLAKELGSVLAAAK